jgi:hypothetical protein
MGVDERYEEHGHENRSGKPSADEDTLRGTAVAGGGPAPAAGWV